MKYTGCEYTNRINMLMAEICQNQKLDSTEKQSLLEDLQYTLNNLETLRIERTKAENTTGLYVVCYEPQYKELILQVLPCVANDAAFFTSYEKAKEMLDVLSSNGKMAFMATVKVENGRLVPDQFLDEA